jgi:molecular chaperone HtpG
MASQPPQATDATEDTPRFFVGSFLLESLTTGMYIEPRDCVREYVQNGLDAIESARAARQLRPAGGRVTIIVDKPGDVLSIKDTGLSIPAENVWETLTSIGASKKALRRNAGFRGIGRLAGIAYCDQLEFRCKAKGENSATVLRFNAAAIREVLRTGESDVDGAFRASISMGESIPAPADEHWTEVRLTGLANAPDELTSVGRLTDYLVNVAPLRYRDAWSAGDKVLAHAGTAGVPIPTIELMIGTSDADLQELRKPHADSVMAGRNRATKLTDIAFLAGGTVAGRRWWGWYAKTHLFGTVQDDKLAGIRVRVRNIQLDGVDIMTRIFARRGSSYGRLLNWYVGEIFVDAVSVIPNARRDGFEDTPEWRDLAQEIYEQVDPLIDAAHTASRSRSGTKTYARIEADIISQVDHIEQEAANPEPADDAEEAKRRDKASKSAKSKARTLAKRLEALDLDDYGEEEQVAIREATVRLREVGGETRTRPTRDTDQDEGPSYPPLLDTVFDVLSGVLDTRTFQKARRALLDRFAGG